MVLQRQHFLLSYFKTLSVGPVGVSNSRPPASQPGAQPSELPVRGRVLLIVHPRLRPPLHFLLDPHVLTLPSSRVPGNPDFLPTASCDPVPYLNANTYPAHLYSTGPVYTHATQALGSIASANYTTLFCNTIAGAQTPFPLVEDPRHFPPSP